MQSSCHDTGAVFVLTCERFLCEIARPAGRTMSMSMIGPGGHEWNITCEPVREVMKASASVPTMTEAEAGICWEFVLEPRGMRSFQCSPEDLLRTVNAWEADGDPNGEKETNCFASGTLLPGVIQQSHMPVQATTAMVFGTSEVIASVDRAAIARDASATIQTSTPKSKLFEAAKGMQACFADCVIVTSVLCAPAMYSLVARDGTCLYRTQGYSETHIRAVHGRIAPRCVNSLGERAIHESLLFFDAYHEGAYIGSFVLKAFGVRTRTNQDARMICIESIVNSGEDGQGDGARMFQAIKEILLSRATHRGHLFGLCVANDFYKYRMFETNQSRAISYQLQRHNPRLVVYNDCTPRLVTFASIDGDAVA